MFHIPLSIAAAALLLAASGVFPSSTAPGGDVNALPSGPKSTTTTRDNQQDAKDAYEHARAECRGVARDERRACIARAQRDYDKTLRPPVPPRPARPLAPPSR